MSADPINDLLDSFKSEPVIVPGFKQLTENEGKFADTVHATDAITLLPDPQSFIIVRFTHISGRRYAILAYNFQDMERACVPVDTLWRSV